MCGLLSNNAVRFVHHICPDDRQSAGVADAGEFAQRSMISSHFSTVASHAQWSSPRMGDEHSSKMVSVFTRQTGQPGTWCLRWLFSLTRYTMKFFSSHETRYLHPAYSTEMLVPRSPRSRNVSRMREKTIPGDRSEACGFVMAALQQLDESWIGLGRSLHGCCDSLGSSCPPLAKGDLTQLFANRVAD
jgi:hypothetical protein